ncbi:MAG TPA: cytochrome P460 family protein [Bryobacteraceae bacterium]|nr:cytochrome P460 family protein [Bryobacteraceae bacterium]
MLLLSRLPNRLPRFFLGVILLVSASAQDAAGPRFNAKDELELPANYREWVWLSSGLGMTYGPAAEANRDRAPMFDNVFASPAAYRSFLATGKWPEHTTLLLEIRGSISKGSINNGGHYQSDLIAIEGEVKDSARFPGNGWAFFAFGKSATGRMIPRSQDCYTCHPTKGAVDNTFVQFYPTLLPIARAKGTLNPAFPH